MRPERHSEGTGRDQRRVRQRIAIFRSRRREEADSPEARRFPLRFAVPAEAS